MQIEVKQTVFPRWRGFNLLGMFCSQASNINRGRAPGYFIEEDFQIIEDFGFNFVRLPLSYRVWGDVHDPFKVDEARLAPLDQAVEYGIKHHLHVNICMHRIPGFCVLHGDEPEEETLNLWKDEKAMDAAACHWRAIAQRYTEIGSEQLSFNIVNEPTRVDTWQYADLIDKVVSAVREVSPDRLFIIDGVDSGDYPPPRPMLQMQNCGYSLRGYEPRSITHYGQYWRYTEDVKPCWPGGLQAISGDKWLAWDRAYMDRYFGLWAAMASYLKVGVHCGEFGCSNRVPHDIVLAWMRDLLDSLKSFNIGYAMWNLYGVNGVMDSKRADVEYKKCGRHLLDEKMLKLMQEF